MLGKNALSGDCRTYFSFPQCFNGFVTFSTNLFSHLTCLVHYSIDVNFRETFVNLIFSTLDFTLLKIQSSCIVSWDHAIKHFSCFFRLTNFFHKISRGCWMLSSRTCQTTDRSCCTQPRSHSQSNSSW